MPALLADGFTSRPHEASGDRLTEPSFALVSVRGGAADSQLKDSRHNAAIRNQ
jgi:hypothetical protein